MNDNCSYQEYPIWNGKVFRLITDYVETLDINDVFPSFKKLYDDNIDLVNYALSIFASTYICIVVYVHQKKPPKLFFDKAFMEMIKELNANIDIDYYP